MPALWGDSGRVICFPGNTGLLDAVRSGLRSRRKGKTAPPTKGRGSDESAHLRQQQIKTMTSRLTEACLTSRCTLVSIYQEYSQTWVQAPPELICCSEHDSISWKTAKTANSVERKRRSSWNTSQGWRRTWVRPINWTLAKGPWTH